MNFKKFPPKINIYYIWKKFIAIYVYIFTKRNNYFKFSISLKSYEEESFPRVPQNASLFSLRSTEIFTNKKKFSKGDIHVLLRTFFSKMYNKKHLRNCTPLNLMRVNAVKILANSLIGNEPRSGPSNINRSSHFGRNSMNGKTKPLKKAVLILASW